MTRVSERVLSSRSFQLAALLSRSLRGCNPPQYLVQFANASNPELTPRRRLVFVTPHSSSGCRKRMNVQDPAHLLQQVLLCMPRGIWHALDVAANFSPSLQQSSGLTAFELETLLLSTGVIQWRGEETRFSLLAMENLQATFPTATSLHIQHHRLVRGNPKHYFLCIDRPHQNSTPQTQLQNAGCRVMQRP